MVYSWIVEEHLLCLEHVFQRFREKGIKLKLSKGHVFKQEATYFGNLAIIKRYTIDLEDKRAVSELKERKPTCIGEVRKLNGFLRFHRTGLCTACPFTIFFISLDRR